MLGDSCDGFNAILAAHFNDELGGDDVCFDVVASLLDVRIYGTVVLTYFTNIFIIIEFRSAILLSLFPVGSIDLLFPTIQQGGPRP